MTKPRLHTMGSGVQHDNDQSDPYRSIVLTFSHDLNSLDRTSSEQVFSTFCNALYALTRFKPRDPEVDSGWVKASSKLVLSTLSLKLRSLGGSTDWAGPLIDLLLDVTDIDLQAQVVAAVQLTSDHWAIGERA